MDTVTTKAENGLACNTVYTRYVWAYNECTHSIVLTLTQATTTAAIAAPAPGTINPAITQIVWNWNVQITPTAGCTEVIVALNKRTFLGGVDVLGLVSVPLSALWDQQSHSFQLPISAATPKDPRERKERIGEIIMSLRYADYEALRQHLMGSEMATPVAFEYPAVQPLIGASTSSSSCRSSTTARQSNL
jgi:hypothetical protein